MKLNNFEEYRNEIKYFLYRVSRKSLYIQYRLSSLLLAKSYPDRWVNNIYFDNTNFDLFYNSIEGISKRTKVRLRWYGNFQEMKNPVLEFKNKIGHKNIKESVFIKDQILYSNNFAALFKSLTESKDLQKKHKYFLKELRPVLANRYFRSYHSSADNKYRVTTDTSLNFTNLITGSLKIPYWKKPKDITIVELKFKNQDAYITNFMTEIKSRYRSSQISKYTYGLQL